MRVLVDADQMVYACGFATEGEPLEHALHLVNKSLNAWSSLGDTLEVYIGGKGNFRLDVDKEYKAHRPDRKPEHYQDIREFLMEQWDAKEVHGMETDDRVSIELYTSPTPAIVVSPDKDLNNTPGWHYNPRTEEKYWVTPRQALRHLAYQMLAGDRVDNVKGLTDLHKGLCKKKGWHPKCGEATAKKIMNEVRGGRIAMSMVRALYEFHNQEEEYDKNLKLLWMCRYEDEVALELLPDLYNRRHVDRFINEYEAQVS